MLANHCRIDEDVAFSAELSWGGDGGLVRMSMIELIRNPTLWYITVALGAVDRLDIDRKLDR